MKAKDIELYPDGGTVRIWMDTGEYCIDRRLKKPNQVFQWYHLDTGDGLLSKTETEAFYAALAQHTWKGERKALADALLEASKEKQKSVVSATKDSGVPNG